MGRGKRKGRNEKRESYRSNNDDCEKFTVYLYEGERAQIEKWVKIKENIETGGDLFGLWVNNHTAVVQFVLGPGANCKRTTVSFFQDLKYLREAGNYLTQQHGLCNIGQWHSHHRLSLTRPSGGDENTVWGNMPSLGLNRYIVFIATISGYGKHTKVNINPYLFKVDETGAKLPVASGTLTVLSQDSPFRCSKVVVDFMKNGKEIYSGENEGDDIVPEESNKPAVWVAEKQIWLQLPTVVNFTCGV